MPDLDLGIASDWTREKWNIPIYDHGPTDSPGYGPVGRGSPDPPSR